MFRPAVAQDRLRLLADGRVVLKLKTAWADGTRQLLFEPLTLLEKLAALTPAADQSRALPRVLAPHTDWRARVVVYGAPAAESPMGASGSANGTDDPVAAPSSRHWVWGEDADAIRAILAAVALS